MTQISLPEKPANLDPPPYRYWGARKPPKSRADFWNVTTSSVKAQAGDQASSGAKVATLRMYGPIDPWGGWFGISAKDVSAALDQLPDSVEEIRVRLNSPGGDVWEGMAILNMLRAHRATVVAVVDGIAASAASFLAAGCDETVMSPGTQMMVHDASGFCLGQAKDMRKEGEALDSVSNAIASIYAESAGGTAAEWRDVMLEETWYTADEAVQAGLADRTAVVKDEGETTTAGDDPDPFDDGYDDRFDLSIFTYAGRDKAPAPKPPTASAGGSHPRGTDMAFNDDVRSRLGVAEDADEATILAALDEALAERADPPTQPTATQPPGDPSPTQAAPTAPAAPAQPAASTPGTMVIDSSAWDAQQERIKRLEAADIKRRRDERDQIVDQAVTDGKFRADRKDHWKRLWDADPEGTRTVIDGLTKGVIPVNEFGHAADDDIDDDELDYLYGPPPATKGA